MHFIFTVAWQWVLELGQEIYFKRKKNKSDKNQNIIGKKMCHKTEIVLIVTMLLVLGWYNYGLVLFIATTSERKKCVVLLKSVTVWGELKQVLKISDSATCS